MMLRVSPAESRGSVDGPLAAIHGQSNSRAQATIDTSPRISAQRRLIEQVFPNAGPKTASERQALQRRPEASGAVAQRYTQAPNGLKVSANGQFAVRNEGEHGQLYVAHEVTPFKLQHVTFNKERCDVHINGAPMSEVQADLANKPAMDQMQCGHFSRAVTGITETQENENAPPGRSLYTANVTHDVGDVMGGRGWENHFAPVIVADGEDRGTFETAVGLNYCWFGIYGSAKGQSFRYKTQVGNISRALKEGWINQDTQQVLMQALGQYKDGTLSANAERQDYVGEELRKLEALALERQNNTPLPVMEAQQTAEPQTKEQQQEEAKRMAVHSVNDPEFERRRQQFLGGNEDRNDQFRQVVMGLSVLALAVLALYWFK
ncbi:hypothetical protein OU995_18935 [Roseateles sp. SL47]|uniref:hypothetical protein n=1 Tax=Roseateles sp. SL47 TaxID=2995138 RepID=UPI00226E049D|nr:hypothetical protein [Roseateles sp. SL47]WAC71644.1 hypothetical protein OU995_18935 [Roseateles sp. SL47]